MNIRFCNARILTMADGMNIIENGELHVRGDKITYIGPTEKSEDRTRQWDKKIDLNGNLIMPGFKNCHTHSGMTFLRSRADDMKLQDWLFNQVFPLEAKLTAEDVVYCSKLAVLEYLTSGVTAICDMYLSPYETATAVENMGMRCVHCGAVSGEDNIDAKIDRMEGMFNNINGKNSLTSFRLGIHAEYTASKELMKKVADLSHKYNTPVYMHNSETKSEVESCKEKYGMTPTELFDNLGMLDNGGVFFHGVHMSENDFEIMKKHNVSVITNPGSNTKLASGIAPIETYLKKGINVGIGTDGPASNNCLDMFREMFLVTGLAKLRENDAAAVDAFKVLEMATVNGARAIDLNDSDVLAAGKNADLIVIDLHQPNMQPLNNIAKNIVYSGSKINVKMTMIGGKILYENGKFNVGEDPEGIYRDVQKIVDNFNNGRK